jgi:hypothetical protein
MGPTGKKAVNGKRRLHFTCGKVKLGAVNLEASPGIEPGCADLQSAA